MRTLEPIATRRANPSRGSEVVDNKPRYTAVYCPQPLCEGPAPPTDWPPDDGDRTTKQQGEDAETDAQVQVALPRITEFTIAIAFGHRERDLVADLVRVGSRLGSHLIRHAIELRLRLVRPVTLGARVGI